MSLSLVVEVWEALRSHLDFNERGNAADVVVNLLIDNNYEAQDIKDAFRTDKLILSALKDYVSFHETSDEYEDDIDDSDDGDNEEEDWN